MRGFSIFGSAALLLVGCAVYDSSLTAHKPALAGGGSGGGSTGGTSGAAGDGTGGSAGNATGGGGMSTGGTAGTGGATCDHKTYPPPPAITNAGGDHQITVIQYNVDLGDSPPSIVAEPTRWQTLGFDLDGKCSTTPALALSERSCALPSNSPGVIDGPDGQDNAMGLVVQLTRDKLTNFSSDIYSGQLKKGAANAIFNITGYNGLADDDQIRVEALVSAQFDAYKDAGATPKWDGNDVWPVASDSVINSDLSKPVNVDNKAYVSNHQMVATLGDTGLRLLIGLTEVTKVNLSLHLHAAFVVCTIEPTDAGPWGFTLKGCTLAGRWTADDLIKQLAEFPDPLDLNHPKPLCTSSGAYPAFKDQICKLRDISSSGTTGPTAPCDALSFGVNYDTLPGRLGDVFGKAEDAPVCPPGTNPSSDSCESDGGPTGGVGSGGSPSVKEAGPPDASGPDASKKDASIH